MKIKNPLHRIRRKKASVKKPQATPPPAATPHFTDAYAPQLPVDLPPESQNRSPALSLPRGPPSSGADVSRPPPMRANVTSEAASGLENFLGNADKQRSVAVQLVFPNGAQPLTMDVLREPFVRASRMIDRALHNPWEEAANNSIAMRLENIPASAWVKIARFISGKASVKACTPTVHEAVAMFAAIDFLFPNPNTQEGKALEDLAEACKSKVMWLPEAEREPVMAEAMIRGLEMQMYRNNYDGQISDYQAARLESVHRRLDIEAHGGRLIAPPPKSVDSEPSKDAQSAVDKAPLRSFPWASVSLATGGQSLQFVGCGFAMASASKTWDRALPNITLDAHIPAEVWNKILCCVHDVGDIALRGPGADDAAAMLQAIRGLEPNDADPTGRALLSLAQQCETLEDAKATVSELRRALQVGASTAIEQALQSISRGDRRAVAHLDSQLVKVVLTSEPWKAARACAYELLIDWARCHGPTPEGMASFMRAHGLDDAVNWYHCPGALREEAIAAGILPKPANLVPHSMRLVRTVQTGQKYMRIWFVDAGELFTHSDEVTRWDLHTGEKIASFALYDSYSRNDREYPTHNGILPNRLFASVNNNCFATSNPTLWDIDSGKRVTSLQETPKCEPPKTRAQAYRFVVSGAEAGAGVSRLRAGVWGKRGFAANYEFLRNFQPDCSHCDTIVSHASSLFTCGMSRGGKYTIEERDLESNTLARAWKVDDMKNSSASLFITQKHIVCMASRKDVSVYSRHAAVDAPAMRFDAEGTYIGAVSDHYLAGMSSDRFTVWDLNSGEVVQSVQNPFATDYKDKWHSIGFDGTTVVVSDNSGRLHYYAADA